MHRIQFNISLDVGARVVALLRRLAVPTISRHDHLFVIDSERLHLHTDARVCETIELNFQNINYSRRAHSACPWRLANGIWVYTMTIPPSNRCSYQRQLSAASWRARAVARGTATLVASVYATTATQATSARTVRSRDRKEP